MKAPRPNPSEQPLSFPVLSAETFPLWYLERVRAAATGNSA